MTLRASVSPATISPSIQEFSGGYGYGFIGILVFSLTFPMTVVAVQELSPELIALGRAWLAGIPACLILWFYKIRRPKPAEWRGIGLACIGIVIGWPLTSTIAMQTVSASHGAVVNGLLPLTTALCGAWYNNERLPRSFWIWAALGAAVVTGYALYAGNGALQLGDLWLVAAVVLGGIGYAGGGKASRTLGGWQTTCWCLAISMPFLTLPTFYLTMNLPSWPPPPILGAFAYLAFGSMFLGFFAWYKGLAMGGIARVGQLLLIQPFLTVVASAWLFGERVPLATYLFALAVIVIIGASRYVTVNHS
jgi:drug/metabolite transporter (DMT)-like permease